MTQICPICKGELYEKNRRIVTGGSFVDVRCRNCNFFDYRLEPIYTTQTYITKMRQ